MAWMIPSLWFPGSYGEMVVQLIPTLLAGACLGAGMLASLAHLGTKKNAVRIFSNLRHSSLSKEVMYACLFGLGLLLMIFRGVVLGHNFMLWTALTGIAGLGLVHNMAQVYRLPAAPGWNTWRTNAGFLISALLLGTAVMTPLLAYGSSINSIQVPSGQWRLTGISILALLLAQLVLMRKRPSQIPAHEIRLGLIVTGVALTALTVFQSNLNLPWISAILLLIVVGEESLGRWCFYQSRL
jgi:anaerobic dimethyl sulfoxide reductase subunit C (anchor subunit)